MTRLLLIAIALFATSAGAALDAPGILPTPIARPILEKDPGVAAARAALEAARLEAGILERSPYEWTAKVSSQRRTLQTGLRFNEWNALIERPWRLPAKASADESLAKATIEEAEARYGEVIHETARELLSAWVDALGAEQGRELAEANRRAAQDNLDAVEKRARAGDASRLDVSFSQAEMADQQRAAHDANTQAAVGWGRLQARFPGIGRSANILSDPFPIKADLTYWRNRILEQNDELKITQAHLERTQALGARTRAEKIPDPTIGLYTASEIGGQERIVGITVSIPLPGGPRSRRAEKSVHTVEAARQEVELKKRQLEADIAAAVATADGSYLSWHTANGGAAAMQNNAKLMQRAYILGEADLQALLSARRQATSAAQIALVAKLNALKAHYLLLIDAHLVWDLDHE